MKTAKLVTCPVVLITVVFGSTAGPQPARAQWPQWGGPNRNFTVETRGLADYWPEEGPRKLWQRELGDGYASIAVDDGVLYTMYRQQRGDQHEFTVALDAKTGKTIWEHKSASPVEPGREQYGFGPNSTPLVSGDRLYTVGANVALHCFDKRSGKVLWKRDLAGELGAPTPGWSYSCSPIAYKNMIIVPVDRQRSDDAADSASGGEGADGKPDKAAEGQSLVAFDQATGKVVWKTQDHRIGHSSPILINFDGRDQLVLLMIGGIMGVDPDNGQLLWHEAFDQQAGNMTTPLWTDGDLLFYSNSEGSRVLELTTKDGRVVPRELWQSRKLRIHHANPIRIGDCVLGSSGQGRTLITCLDIRTGKRLWRERGFGKATCVQADGKLIILDENGLLALATATPEGLTVHSRCRIAEPFAWTAPTLVGTTLYLRDSKHIMALDLS